MAARLRLRPKIRAESKPIHRFTSIGKHLPMSSIAIAKDDPR